MRGIKLLDILRDLKRRPLGVLCESRIDDERYAFEQHQCEVSVGACSARRAKRRDPIGEGLQMLSGNLTQQQAPCRCWNGVQKSVPKSFPLSFLLF